MSLEVQTKASQGQPADDSVRIPPLRNGDHLTSDEFFRRYEAMPGVKAELIDGRVYLQTSPVRNADGRVMVMASPVRHREHGKPHAQVITWLGTYEASTPGVETSDNATLRLDIDNEPQPDVFLRIAPDRGGQSGDSDDGYVVGSPEFVAEIAASSANYDLHEKLHAYRRHGVKEYLVWRIEDQEIDWFVLREGRYEPLAAGEDGVTTSATFPGLWLDRLALLRGELASVLDTLRRGLETPQHAEFVARLKAAASAQPGR